MTNLPDDPDDLDRFVSAQSSTYATALEELRHGAKRGHWIRFVFPQVAGLGGSPMAVRYSIRSRGEAIAYLAHPVLGPRFLECVNALLQHKGRMAEEVMGHPDDLKLRSSMTLFAAVSGTSSPFHSVLDHYFAGQLDPRTVDFLAAGEIE